MTKGQSEMPCPFGLKLYLSACGQVIFPYGSYRLAVQALYATYGSVDKINFIRSSRGIRPAP